MQELEMTDVFDMNYEALFNSDKRYIENIGGTRSSKTFSICQLIIVYCCENKNKKVHVVRKTLSSLTRSFKIDLEAAITQFGLWGKIIHHKSDHTYTFPTGSVIEFLSADDPQRLRGTKRDLLIIDECNEILNEDFLQLSIRTSLKILYMYNPSHEREWMKHIPQDEKITIHSTYKNNPFLTKAQEDEIERLKDKDINEYMVFCLGEKAQSRKNVYSNWEFIDKKPERFKDYIYGIDFGWSAPTAVCRVWYNEDELFIEEVLYQPHIKSYELPSKLESLGVEKDMELICDYASPEAMDELNKAGFYAIKANKSHTKGLSAVRNFKIYVKSSSENIKLEYENYQFKVINDFITDEPIKYLDHLLDGMRYASLYIYDNLRFGSQIDMGF